MTSPGKARGAEGGVVVVAYRVECAARVASAALRVVRDRAAVGLFGLITCERVSLRLCEAPAEQRRKFGINDVVHRNGA